MSWAAAQNVDVVLSIVEHGILPATFVLRVFSRCRSRLTSYSENMGVQEETLERVIKRWKQFLKDLTDEQRAIVELHNPGAVGRLQNRLHKSVLSPPVEGLRHSYRII